MRCVRTSTTEATNGYQRLPMKTVTLQALWCVGPGATSSVVQNATFAEKEALPINANKRHDNGSLHSPVLQPFVCASQPRKAGSQPKPKTFLCPTQPSQHEARLVGIPPLCSPERR